MAYVKKYHMPISLEAVRYWKLRRREIARRRAERWQRKWGGGRPSRGIQEKFVEAFR